MIQYHSLHILLVGTLPALFTLSAIGESEHAPPGGNMIVATYFHGTIRCPGCLEIERISRTVVERTFPAELSNGALLWQSVDYDLPANGHYMKRYRLPYPSLVLSRIQDGKEREWKVLSRMWDLVGRDQEALASYVQDELVAMLGRVDEVPTPETETRSHDR